MIAPNLFNFISQKPCHLVSNKYENFSNSKVRTVYKLNNNRITAAKSKLLTD